MELETSPTTLDLFSKVQNCSEERLELNLGLFQKLGEK
jgi:hypothetical protein